MYVCGVIFLMILTMTVVTSKEFATSQDKYFDLAQDKENEVCILRGANMFYLACSPAEKPVIFEPDDELRSCISMDEARKRTRERIHQYFASKQQ